MNRGFARSWWLALIALGVQQAVAAGVVTVCVLLRLDPMHPAMIVGSMALIVPIIIGGVWAMQMGSPLAEIAPMKSFPTRLLPFCIVLPAMLQQFMVFVLMPVNLVFQGLFGTAQAGIPAPDSFGSFLMSVLGLCIAAPVFEEILCRGVVMKLLEKYGFWVSVIGSACLFAMLHVELPTLLPIFYSGIFFAVLRYATGSVIPCIVAHGANNLFAVLSMMLAESAWGNIVLVILSVLMGLLFPFVLWRFLKVLGDSWKSGIQFKGESRPGMSAALIIFVVFVAVFNAWIIIGRILSGEMYADWQQMFSVQY